MIKAIVPFLNYLSSWYLLIFFSLSICQLTPLLKEPQLITNLSFAVPFATSMVVFYIGFSVFCYLGQLLKDMNVVIAEALYNTPWYEESHEYQKLMYCFQLVLRKSLRLISLYGLETDLRMFLIILSRLYSATNVILSFVKNQ